MRRSLLTVAALLVCVVVFSSARGAYARPYEGARQTGTVLLGEEAVEAHKNHLGVGQAEAFRLRTRTSGVTAAVYVYVDPQSTARAIAVGIYSNARGRPGALLSTGHDSSLTVHAWNTVPVTPTRLVSGKTYWLALLDRDGTLRYRSRRRGACLSRPGARTHLRELPQRWSTGRVHARRQCPISAYVAAAGLLPALNPPASGLLIPPLEPAPLAPVGSAPPSNPASPVGSAPPEEPATAPTAPTNVVAPSIKGFAVVGDALSVSHGTWLGSPTSYAYRWEDCNALGEGCSSIMGATTSSYTLTASDLGSTVRAVVSASNAGGVGSASSAATLPVVSSPPPLPTNTALPSIGGSAVEGQTLTASNGAWSGSPTSYAYQWQSCKVATCSNIVGATAATRVLASSDVGHTLRVVVKATNAGGTGEATSAATAVVSAEQGGTPENCFANPEACGYPGPNNTGVANCAELPKSSGSKTITKSETIENTNITGSVTVTASGVTLNHDCVIFNGGEAEGSAAVVLESAASNFTISNTTVRAENTTSASFEEAIRNNHSNAGAVASKDRFEDCAECIHQLWTLNESYVLANGREKADEDGTAHTEDWWFSNNAIVANDDTLLNPSKQTAVIFAESGGSACSNHEKITNSLLAGGGFVFYFCAHSTGAGSSSIEIKNNRFARQICTKKEIENYERRGGFGCQPEGGYFEDGEGSGGYFPRGGFFGLVSEGEGLYNQEVGWEGNFWDDDLEAQGEEAY